MALTSLMQMPLANANYVCTSGQVYTSNGYGIIYNILSVSDQTDLTNQGGAILYPVPTGLLFSLKGVNFNITTDQLLTSYFQGKYRIDKITVLNTSVNGMSTAAGGLYTAASKGGTTIVASGQVYTGLTNALTAVDLTLNAASSVQPSGTPLYLSLTTGQGAAATADLYAYGKIYI